MFFTKLYATLDINQKWGVGGLTAIITDVNYRMSQAIIRDLGASGARVVVCHRDDPHATPPLGFFSKYAAERHTLSSESYEDELFDLCRRIRDDEGRSAALLPVGAATLALLATDKSRARFSSVCGLMIPSSEQLALLNDKGRVAALAESLDIPVPRSYIKTENETIDAFAARVPLPCVIKPRWGEGLGLTASMRYVIARDTTEFIRSFADFSALAGEPPLIQEYLPGAASGCSVLAQDGEIVRKICHRRVREFPVSGGPSTCCDAIRAPELVETTARLVNAVGLNGLAMFEYKNDADGVPRLLEVNPRVWGSYPLTRVTKSGFSYAWFILSLNAGNPDALIPCPPEPEFSARRMVFFPSDLASAKGYFSGGKKKLAFGAIADMLRPRVRDGLFEWRDARPALRYWRSLLKRG